MQIKRIAADTNAALPAGTIIRGVSLMAGSDASSVKLYDAATVTGTDFFGMNALTSDNKYVPFPPLGKKVNTGVSVDITGTGAVAYIFYD